MAAHLTSDDKRADASAKIMKETDVQLNEFKLVSALIGGLQPHLLFTSLLSPCMDCLKLLYRVLPDRSVSSLSTV